MRELKPCGTHSAWRRHMTRGEVPCDACKQARKEWAADHYQKNKAKINAKYKKYYEANKEKIQKYLHEYNKENNEKLTAQKREYYKNNKDAHQAAMRRREIAKRGTRVEKYTKQNILDKWGTCCHICKEEIDLTAPRSQRYKGWERGLQLDHVIPVSKGGTDTIDNVKPAHGICNLSKATKDIDEMLAQENKYFV